MTPTSGSEADCFDPAELPNYLYVEIDQFKACPANCKKCTGKDTCIECGSYEDPNKTIFVAKDGQGKIICVSECLLANSHFQIVNNQGISECLQCLPAKPHRLHSKDPITQNMVNECVNCAGKGGNYILNSLTKECIQCGSNCGACDINRKCLSCSDPAMFVQVDGETCAANCAAEGEERSALNHPHQRSVLHALKTA